MKLPLLGRLKRRLRLRRAMAAVALLNGVPTGRPHDLPGSLILSLTSFPPRFATLALTIKGLLHQTVLPDAILLWIAEQDLPHLPEEVLELRSDLFRIEKSPDLRSFKKILPSLERYPESFILIADDDTYYPPQWLERIAGAHDEASPAALCTRAHRPTYEPDGRFAPYRAWERNVLDVAPAGEHALFATGNGGVLYPPGCLPPEAADWSLAHQLSPTSDDVWLYFMRRRNGWPLRRVPGPKQKFVEWPTSQAVTLTEMHKTGVKDRHIRDMTEHFGMFRRQA